MNGPLPEPGDFACVSVGGPGGALIGLGERMAGAGFSAYEHAFVYVGGMLVVEAEPHGARLRKLGAFEAHGQVTLWSTGAIDLTDAERAKICTAARFRVGIGYSALDYLAIGLHHAGIPAPGLRRFIASGHRLTCAQLIDDCYADAGVRLFDDGRWAGYVMPSDLAELIERRPRWGLPRPGKRP